MFIDVDRYPPFVLDREFLSSYENRPVQWGFGDLSWVTYQRTYSRDGEQWWQTCRRVIEGAFTVQQVHCRERGLPFNPAKAQNLAQRAYDRMWSFKWTPPGRGLWIMGTRYMYERGGAALNNCGFVSTRDLADDYAAPFVWMLHMSMLGVGVGFDTRGAGAVSIARSSKSNDVHVIDDSREGWAGAVRRLLNAFVGATALPKRWDYSRIRPQGSPLKSFGGMASGPEPLREMLERLESLYERYIDRPVDSTLIVDTMNVIGRCVVAGGIRRSAQIAFGDPGDTAFLDLKEDKQKVSEYRWASNNSVMAEVGMDYEPPARRTVVNGEPGYLWLANARAYGRMTDLPDWADARAEGSNPCVEQTLWDRELCCLVETYPARHETYEDFEETLRVAFLYAKAVTLVPTHDDRTNVVMQRNRRIGCSMTGIVQAINKFGYRQFLNWCDRAYACVRRFDERYSDWLVVPRSIKTTSVKPSGTVSLLAGATPGVHWDHAPYYIRRMRLAESHPLVDMCRKAGYPVEPSVTSENAQIVSFPVHVPGLARRKRDVSVWEKVDLAAQLQRFWSDNQVSCTAEFDPHREVTDIPRILAAYEDRLKAIVFLPAAKHGYEQPPYEEISEDRYRKLRAVLRPLTGAVPHEPRLEAQFCEGGPCELA